MFFFVFFSLTGHIGNTCEYDGGLITNINNHRISVYIDRFMSSPPVPTCYPQNNCQDCTDWVIR